jgi:hypothetical protein
MAELEAKKVGRAVSQRVGCPVVMSEGKLCGRPLSDGSRGLDPRNVCLMHSRNPTKDVDEFQKEFERILEAAENRVADFRESSSLA